MIFYSGNTKITIMENYEALGRYIAAKEQAESFHIERDKLLGQIKALCENSISRKVDASDYFEAKDFEAAKVEELLKTASEAHRNMVTAIEEANRYAKECNKSELKFW